MQHHRAHFLDIPLVSDVLGLEVTRVGKPHEVCAFVEFAFMWDDVSLPLPKDVSAGSAAPWAVRYIPVVSTDVIFPVESVLKINSCESACQKPP